MAKILIYAMLEGIGGVEEYVLNLMRYGEKPESKYGYLILGEKTVYEKELQKGKVDYFFIPPKRKIIKNIKAIKSLFKQLKGKYEIIYFNTSGLYYPIPYLLAIFYGYKIVLHSHSSEVNDKRKVMHLFNRFWINKFLFKRFACSTPAANWMFGKNIDNVVVIPNAINLQKFRYNADSRNIIREELGLLNNEFLIGHIGRLTHVKNQQRLLYIFSYLVTKDTHMKLILVGDGEDEIQLRDTAKSLDIEKDVMFYGRTNHPEKILCAMDCFVMPSLLEGFPISLVEAQASGLPCIISDNITKEVNITGQISFLSLTEKDSIWAEKILKCKKYLRYDNIQLLQKAGYDLSAFEKNIMDYLKD